MSEKELEDLTDEEVKKVAKECGFEVIKTKHFENDTIYYLKEDKDEPSTN